MKGVKKFCIYSFIPLFVFEYFLMMWDFNLNKYVGLPLMLLLVCFGLKDLFMKPNHNSMDGFITAFFIYNLLSFVWFIFSGVPQEGYITMAKYFLFPILFYFFGRDDNNEDMFYKSFMWAMCFVFVVGLFWYITTPSYYLEFLINQKQETSYLVGASSLNEDNIMQFASLSSFVNVYVTSLLCVPTMAIAYGFLFRKEVPLKKTVLYLIGALSLVVAILTFQRIAIFCAILTFIFYSFWGIKKKDNKIAFSGVILIVLIVFVVSTKYADRIDTMIGQFDNVLATFSFSEAMKGGRMEQYTNVLNEWKNPLIGSGMGSASAVARSIGRIGVTDGEYVRLLAETGIIGFLLFLIISIKAVLRVLKDINRNLIEAVIILFFLLACIGANALSNGQIIPPVFWYAVGKLYNNTQFSKKII